MKTVKIVITCLLCAGILAGCGDPETPKVDTDMALKKSYTNSELLAVTGYRKGAVKLASSVKTPSYKINPTALSIKLKAEHLVMNKGIKIKKSGLTEVEAKKAGYASLSALKATAKKILIKQNKALKSTVTGNMICSEAFAESEITVTEKDRQTYKKLAARTKKNEYSDSDIEKMLFVGAVIAKEKTKLNKSDMSGKSSSDYSSYSDVYKGEAAKIATEKAISTYCKKIRKK